jgi:hypothetical protein
MAGAPIGNQNATRGRVWRQAIERALERRSKSRADGIAEIDALADQLLTLVAQGDLQALKEFGDRIEGRPAQTIGGDPENPLEVKGLAVLWGTGADSQAPRET